MAYEEALRCITLRAPSTAFSARQHQMVRADTTAGYFRAGSSVAGAGAKAVGVLQDAPTVAGEACQIAFGGVTKVVSASTKLKPGSMYICGANGVALSTASAGAKQVIYGPWLSAAASTGTKGSAVFDVVGITT